MPSYDRYSQFRQDGEISIVPYGEVPPKDTDYFEVYYHGKTRLDILSYQYYNDSSYGWLIMQAKYQQMIASYEEKKMERARDAQDEYYNFITEYPTSKHRKEADKMLVNIKKTIKE